MNINEIKTKVVQRFIRALGRYIKKYSWIIYLNVIIGVVGYSIDSWEYWVITIPTILLQSQTKGLTD